ncbi:cytochrome c oxidase assembly protein [Achromobacter aloeverae]|nr:cytochrome c oxidase assembly protein [Achromobacter aloeverae]
MLASDAPLPDFLAWTAEPWIVALMALSLLLYLAGYARLARRTARKDEQAPGRALRRKRLAAFALGWLALAAALLSPLDGLSAALFSAHMLQHELLMIVAAPLLVLGRPLAIWLWALPPGLRRSIGGWLHARRFRAVWRPLSAPLGAWILHATALWAWHVPTLFQAALEHPAIHVLQHFSFLATALLFWWTAFPQPSAGNRTGHAMLGLFTTMVHTAALGALLTLAPGVWYPDYIEPTSALGLDPVQDQQLGGLIMWVPGGLAYLAAGLAVASRWLLRRSARPVHDGVRTTRPGTTAGQELPQEFP